MTSEQYRALASDWGKILGAHIPEDERETITQTIQALTDAADKIEKVQACVAEYPATHNVPWTSPMARTYAFAGRIRNILSPKERP